jgi:hypothetical protein
MSRMRDGGHAGAGQTEVFLRFLGTLRALCVSVFSVSEEVI